MAEVLDTLPTFNRRTPQVIDLGVDHDLITIETLVGGVAAPAIVHLIHERSGRRVLSLRTNAAGDGTVLIERGVTWAETYTLVGVDPAGVAPPAAVDGVRPPATVNLNLAAPSSGGSGHFFYAG